MKEIESSKHLYEPPIYLVKDNVSYSSFDEALKASQDILTIDYGALASFFSYGYVTGDRTLFNEIKRKPWLSKLTNAGDIVLEAIPKHDFYAADYSIIAERFHKLLLTEARDAIKGFDKVYVLLSGGLDSRIVAGLVSSLYINGEIKNKPIGITWGLENSRDVQYGKRMANVLNFEWEYVPIFPGNVLNNIDLAGKKLGLIHSPELLHNMNWINENTGSNSIVLAGSFGDSVGRGEFGGVHLLKMEPPALADNFNLLSDNVRNQGNKQVLKDIENLKNRSSSLLDYSHNEHFMQGYRMRNGLCHALSIINEKSNIYQMFTSPSVYEFIWSIHPSYRGDEIYEDLLIKNYPNLASVPWARTNKAIIGETIDAKKDLLKDYHLYTKWSRDELKEELESIIDIDWLEKTGLFKRDSLINLRNVVRNSQSRIGRTNEFWLWIAGFKKLNDHINLMGKTIDFNDSKTSINTEQIVSRSNKLKKIALKYVSQSSTLTSLGKSIRELKRRKELKNKKSDFLVKFPIKQLNN